jgi:hypothetical protein
MRNRNSTDELFKASAYLADAVLRPPASAFAPGNWHTDVGIPSFGSDLDASSASSSTVSSMRAQPSPSASTADSDGEQEGGSCASSADESEMVPTPFDVCFPDSISGPTHAKAKAKINALPGEDAFGSERAFLSESVSGGMSAPVPESESALLDSGGARPPPPTPALVIVADDASAAGQREADEEAAAQEGETAMSPGFGSGSQFGCGAPWSPWMLARAPTSRVRSRTCSWMPSPSPSWSALVHADADTGSGSDSGSGSSFDGGRGPGREQKPGTSLGLGVFERGSGTRARSRSEAGFGADGRAEAEWADARQPKGSVKEGEGELELREGEDKPAPTAFSLAFATAEPYFAWLEAAAEHQTEALENASNRAQGGPAAHATASACSRLRRFGAAMRGSARWEGENGIMDGE